jgi:hypothetical protein
MTDLIDHMIAYYVAGPANDLEIATRWYPYGDLATIVEDKFMIATRKFGMKVRSQSKVAGKQFLDAMLEKGAWIGKDNGYGGQMYQFQSAAFKAALREQQASDPVIAPIIAKAAAEGPDYWAKAFGELVA